jgi:CO dehydrogenase/acetyl-CoA synthase epsilon subunit
MKKFKVSGNVNVVVTKEVWANNADEAMEKAQERLSCLTAYCGNGGWDKLVGVENHDESLTFLMISYMTMSRRLKMIPITLSVLVARKNAKRVNPMMVLRIGIVPSVILIMMKTGMNFIQT